MKYITVGYVANTHGLRGEVKIKLHTDFIEERFAKGAILLLEKKTGYEPLEVVSAYVQKGMVVATFASYTNINQVEEWKGMRLVVEKEQLPELESNEIYFHDLMHMEVVDEQGKTLGEVVEIIETGAHEIIRVRGEKELLIPYVQTFIIEANVKEHRLVVHLLEGML